VAETPDLRLTHGSFVRYIDRSRRFYAAKGFERPYEWASFADVPFAPMSKSMADSRVGLVTTSFPHVDGTESATPRAPKVVYHRPISPRPSRMFTGDLSWDKDATHTDDTETFLPLRRLAEFEDEGRIGTVNHRFYGVPTGYSQRKAGLDAEVIAEWCGEDEVDAVLLVPL